MLVYRMELMREKVEDAIKRNFGMYWCGTVPLATQKEEMRKIPYGPYQSTSWLTSTGESTFDWLQQNVEPKNACWRKVFNSYDVRQRAGCSSITDLLEWFKSTLILLEDHHFNISTYEVERVEEHAETKQIRFESNAAVLVETFSIEIARGHIR